MTILALSIVCGVLVTLLGISMYFNYKHGILILSFQDAIEAALDILDIKYARMSQVLETPIFFDSIEVRQVISDIRDIRDSILYIANNISKFSTYEEEENLDD
tara:strand:- start:495 stop:803 length:309 start_codon:yes stop_codon:yes gene_type:complete